MGKTNPKAVNQIDGNEDYPTLFKFTVMGSTFYAAQDKKVKYGQESHLLDLQDLLI